MRNDKSINFKPFNSEFKPAKNPISESFYDNSFFQSDKAIGNLRLPAVDNGRYESKHPIMDVSGNTVGFLSNGKSSIGYTYNCIYAGNCFWIAHEKFNRGGSYVSVIDDAGTFLFSSTRKFDVINSFPLNGDWAEFSKAFKLINNGDQLIYVASKGFCLFNTKTRNVHSKADFTRFLSDYTFNFTISPNGNLLALAASTMRGKKDPIDNEFKYDNFIWVFDLNDGSLIGEKILDIDKSIKWVIDFSENGMALKLDSSQTSYQFELK